MKVLGPSTAFTTTPSGEVPSRSTWVSVTVAVASVTVSFASAKSNPACPDADPLVP